MLLPISVQFKSLDMLQAVFAKILIALERSLMQLLSTYADLFYANFWLDFILSAFNCYYSEMKLVANIKAVVNG